MTRKGLNHPLWLLIGLGMMGLAIWALPISGFDWVICPFKRLTAWPCPGCGSTRALRALMGGRIWLALTINPLGIAAGAAIAGLLLYEVLPAGFKMRMPRGYYSRWIQKPWVIGLILILVGVNWAYLTWRHFSGIFYY